MAAANEAALAADTTTGAPAPGSFNFKSLLENKLLLALGAAAVIALMVVFWLWSQKPEYRVLFSSYSDKDGGAIVAALEQMNVPYKIAEGGSAILVPANNVHDIRLKLASQGLPKGGNIGFELLENQKFGVSQFVEQVNFQRGLEGELERTIQSIGAVQAARIHLAMPKPTVFTRDQQKPTASVMLNLHPGRALDQRQVSAIVHLVASSVPELPTSNVTVVDQNGNLLSDNGKDAGANNQLDPTQLKYVDELQQNIVRRVESIIAPLVGAKNVHAEASAEVDFSVVEQAAEIYKPNQAPDSAAIRSSQNNESQTLPGQGTGGVPGALTNQPPAPATAPIVAPGSEPTTTTNANVVTTTTTTPPGTTVTTPIMNSERNTTTNYEVDKTVRYQQQPMGGIKRLTVAVVVNHKSVVDAQGKVTTRPLTDDEKTQISDLAKQAMGFNEERGDSLSVVNSSFMPDIAEVFPEVPLWKDPENIDMAKEWLKNGLVLLVLYMLYRRFLRPLLRKLSPEEEKKDELAKLDEEDQDAIVRLSDGEGGMAAGSLEEEEARSPAERTYKKNLETARKLAKENPKVVASIVTNWVNGNE
ncbi:flagellar basal-body MS-ring/collar protein FliF [Methylobacillus sp. Pita2]|uniref:flagellar basal-body MS-ring/collar protein FliF n=1 Tax=Methylobacillus TaxID=404 RepID=UPI002853FA5D|nr:flagellar basal-body MS-ring/collar protein FliF [Methylobacillus flagellatus]MDR5172597.1 flagellar M-ring protein FliF [Methylobacillus flagellatus]